MNIVKIHRKRYEIITRNELKHRKVMKTTLKNELEVDGAAVFDNTVELNSSLIDINGSVAAGKTDYRLSSVGTVLSTTS